MPVVARLLVSLLLATVGLLLALLGIFVDAIGHWLAWLFVFAVIEPLALFLFLGALYGLVPGSSLGRLLAWTYGRARIVIWVVLSAAALATVIGLAWYAVT